MYVQIYSVACSYLTSCPSKPLPTSENHMQLLRGKGCLVPKRWFVVGYPNIEHMLSRGRRLCRWSNFSATGQYMYIKMMSGLDSRYILKNNTSHCTQSFGLYQQLVVYMYGVCVCMCLCVCLPVCLFT